MEWVTQWHETNKMYYNPNSEYKPWPRWDDLDATDTPSWPDPLPDTAAHDMDPENPRSLPTSDEDTLNMDATYYDFGEGISTDDIINAGGVIVDNDDVAGAANEIIVDDTGPGFSYSPAGGWTNWDNDDGYYNDNYQNIRVDQETSAEWEFDVNHAGQYEVMVSFSTNNNRSSDIDYTIEHANGSDTINKSQYNSSELQQEWESLGTYEFNAGNDAARVTMLCNDHGEYVAVDAIKLVSQFEIDEPDVLFESTGPWDNSTSGDDYYSDDYLWTPDGYTNYTATWTANNLDDTEEYNVYALWTANNSRSQSVEYQINHSGGTETVSVNQRKNSGQWVQLAEELSFGSDSGTVVLDHDVHNASSTRACADAVAFVPSGGPSPINLVRAHYYVKSDSDDNMYLVNLDGEIEYWRVNDENGNMEIDTMDELERVDDPPADIVTDRSYEEERVNFANWYSFYRKRELTAKNAVSNVIDDIQGVYIGMRGINGQVEQWALPVNVRLNDTPYDQSETLLGKLYDYDSGGGTPLRNGLKDIGEYFSGGDPYGTNLRPGSIYGQPDYISNFVSEESYPFFLADKGGECQQAFSIALTDGFWNGSSPSVGNEDGPGEGDSDFDGPPFADDYSNTLADVAMRYYEDDLNEILADYVPKNTANSDDATHQHMVTYSVSFGVSGTIDWENYSNCPNGNCPEWTDPFDSDKKKIDDLYHAAINGRGKYLNANNPEELLDALERLKSDIESQLGSAAAVATNSIQRQAGSKIYQGVYHTDNWYGDVISMDVNRTTGDIETGEDNWSASSKLDEKGHEERVIFTYDGSSGMAFTSGNADDIGLSGDLIEYLRGDTSNNQENGGSYRVRSSKLGDVVHSAPHLFDGVIYIGANDGMMHAFDAETGEELFAYVPKIVLDAGNLPDYADPGYSHKFYVDNTLHGRKTDSASLVVGGLRQGGKGYFCLDVSGLSDPPVEEEDASDAVKWEYAADNDDDLGYSYSQAFIAKTKAEEWVVIFGNGYGSVNEEAVLYVLDADDGTVIKKFHTGAAGCNGLSTPAVADVNADGYIEYVYAGDLQGNLWKFSLTGDSVSDWGFAYSDGGTAKPLIRVKNDAGGQPITVQPDVTKMDCNAGQDGFFVVFGTGQYIGTTDFDDTSQQSFYGVWDWQDNWPEEERADKYLGEFTATESDPVLTNAPDAADNLTLLEQTASDAGDEWREFTDNSIDYFVPPDGDADMETDHAGWYFNLNDERARVIRDPDIQGGTGEDVGIVTFISSIHSESPCAAGGDSWLYRVSLCTGGKTDRAQFDTNEDQEINADDDARKGGKSFDQMLYTPIQLEDRLYLNDSTGNINTVQTPYSGEGILYWRWIR
ncbi:MAG: PilC/PilY family type IV pilus protein [Desulfosudaceae bacterium]